VNNYFPEAGLKQVCKLFLRAEELFLDSTNLGILMLTASE
jgi:hypothetical protein